MDGHDAAAGGEMGWLHIGERLVVIDKPAGLLAVPGRGADKADCALARVERRIADARVVHRLDQATSGLLVFARGAAMQRDLCRRFETRQVRKAYIAVVSGLPANDDGTIDLALGADWPNRPRQKVDPERGKPATTRWRVLERDPVRARARLHLEPLSGRSHQLRVHLAAIGHPIVGDRLYAPAPVAGAAPRLLLHAAGIDLGVLGPGEPPAVFASAPPF